VNNDLVICRCQEITKAELEDAIRKNDLRLMREVKRLTRAGMGLCQAKTCGHLVMGILARESGQALSEVQPDTVRPPVRTVPVGDLANRKVGTDEG
jgi:NAD(P)H-nitrite reductase large subunit